MKRRAFLQQTAIVSAGIIAMPGFAFKSNQKIGLQLYTLRDIIGTDLSGLLKKISQVGYGEVEMYGLSTDNKFFGLTVTEVAAMLKANNLTSPGGHYSPDDFLFNNGNGDDVKKICDVANTLANNYVIIPWLDKKKINSIDKYKGLAGRLNLAGEICKKAGLQLAYHNHDFEFEDINGQNGYDILLNHTDNNLVKMEMDLYWVVRAGHDPMELFKAHPGRFHLWHVKDMDKNNKDQNTEVGNGCINFKKIFSMSKQAGVKHYIVEQENNYAPDYYGSITASSKNLRKLLGKYM